MDAVKQKKKVAIISRTWRSIHCIPNSVDPSRRSWRSPAPAVSNLIHWWLAGWVPWYTRQYHFFNWFHYFQKIHHCEKCDCRPSDRQASQGTKFTEIQQHSIKNRILAAASAPGHALGLEPDQSEGRAKRQKKNKRSSLLAKANNCGRRLWMKGWERLCLPKTFSKLRTTMYSCVVGVQLTDGPLSFELLPSFTISESWRILVLNPSLSVAVIHHEEKCIKSTLQVDPQLPRRAVIVACSRCRFRSSHHDRRQDLQERDVRLQLGCICP